MKESVLYSIIILLILFSLYKNRSKYNVAIISLAVALLLIQMVKRVYETKQEKEHFNEESAITTVTNSVFVDPEFREKLFDPLHDQQYRNLKENLVYYVSTFDTRFIDVGRNVLISHVNSDMFGSLEIDGLSTDNLFHQDDGIHVKKMVNTPSAKDLLDNNFDDFTVFWYMKLIMEEKWFYINDDNVNKKWRKCYEGENPNSANCAATIPQNDNNVHVYSFFEFDHENIISQKENFSLFEIRFTFKRGHYNPTIDVLFRDTKKQIWSYTYRPTDYFNKKILTDGNFHLFTFVKLKGKLFLYIDDKKLINCSDEGCFDANTFQLYRGEQKIKIRDSPMRINDNIVDLNSNRGLQFKMNAFGIYRNRLFTDDNADMFVSNLLSYFTDIKEYMKTNRHYAGEHGTIQQLQQANLELTNRLSSFEHQACPFNDQSLCSSDECKYINNWNNIGHLADTPRCFNKVMEYCNSNSNADRETICDYLQPNSLGRLARNLQDDPSFQNGRESSGSPGSCPSPPSDPLSIRQITLDSTNRNIDLTGRSESVRILDGIINTPSNAGLPSGAPATGGASASGASPAGGVDDILGSATGGASPSSSATGSASASGASPGAGSGSIDDMILSGIESYENKSDEDKAKTAKYDYLLKSVDKQLKKTEKRNGGGGFLSFLGF